MFARLGNLPRPDNYARRYDEAVRTGRIAVELTPDSALDLFSFGPVFGGDGPKGRSLERREHAQDAQRWAAPWRGYFGYVAGVLGHLVAARSVVSELETRREKGYSPALPIAWTDLGLGETAAALDWMETALGNATRTWDRYWYSPVPTLYASQQDSGDWHTNSSFRPSEIPVHEQYARRY